MGITCEDLSGNPLGTGTVYISIAGVSPFLIEYKLTSSSTWITSTTNGAAESSIPGLSNGGIYDVRVTSCGISTATQVTIGQPGVIHAVSNQQPCVGNPYELALPQLPGAAYEWKNAAGTVVSTSYNYTIASYNMSFDGKYSGKLTWSGCVSRTDTVTLNSTLCGAFIVLPVKFQVFTAKSQNCSVTLNWKISNAPDLTLFSIERSANGNSYATVGTILPAASNSYSYTDNSLMQGTVFYRLKIITADGRIHYSNTISTNARCNGVNTQWTAYPSLVEPGGLIKVQLHTTETGLPAVSMVVTSITGQRAFVYDVPVHQGQNNYILPDKKLLPGTYLLCIYDKNLVRIGGVQKFVYR